MKINVIGLQTNESVRVKTGEIMEVEQEPGPEMERIPFSIRVINRNEITVYLNPDKYSFEIFMKEFFSCES
jgi:hypothetical protein